MALSLNPGFPSSPHHDVLTASPSTSEEKLRLVDEIKRRGRSAVSTKSYPDAELLYGRAIEVLDTLLPGQEKDIAVLYSNRSLARLQLRKVEGARSDAEKATEYDPTYVKGYWRLGQALSSLSRTEEALAAFESALALDGTNKALKKECEKLRVKIEQDRLLMKADEFDGGSASSAPAKKRAPAAAPAKKTVAITDEKKTESKSAGVSSSTVSEKQEDGTFSKSDHVRGYKVVDGKKTTYFHHEQTEEEKRLIGDIAPKRLDAAAPSEEKAEVQEGGASAWNKAGTWEERDVTPWAKETLQASLLTTSYTFPEGSPDAGARCVVTRVSNLEGHASHATVRTKKRYIYEFAVTVHWTVTLTEGDVCSGKMTFPDIDGTVELGEGYDMTDWTVDGGAPAEARYLLERFVRDGGLRDKLHECLDDWVRLFRATY